MTFASKSLAWLPPIALVVLVLGRYFTMKITFQEHESCFEARFDHHFKLSNATFEVAHHGDEELMLRLPFGSIRGFYMEPDYHENLKNHSSTLHRNESPRAFLGIPFALPPVGQLRYEMPQLWNKSYDSFFGHSILDGTVFAPQCMQVVAPNTKKMSEDCLYLNVFLPPSGNVSTSKRTIPVMIWIFGGAFEFGSSGTGKINDGNLYSGSHVSFEHNVIIVTLNYRVGIFGFLNLPFSNMPLNLGIHDQRLAIRFIQEFIIPAILFASPTDVTLFGYSSGAYSTLTLALDPTVKNIRRIISMSPPLGLKPRTPVDAQRVGLAEIHKTSCYKFKDDAYMLKKCLKSISSLSLILSGTFSRTGWYESVLMDPIKFLPVEEPVHVPAGPLQRLLEDSRNNSSSVLKNRDLLIGVTKHEAMLYLALTDLFGYWDGGSFFWFKGQNWTAPMYFMSWFLDTYYQDETSQWLGRPLTHAERQYVHLVRRMFPSDYIFQQVIKLYPPSKSLDHNLDVLTKLITEFAFTCPVRKFALTASEYTENAYMYEVVHVPEWMHYIFGPGSRLPRTPVVHASDVTYFWNYFPVMNNTDKILSDIYSSYWTSFANGTMNQNSSLPHWPKFSKKTEIYMELETKPIVRHHGLRVGICSFWDSVGYKNSFLDAAFITSY